ncbi:hypothetical protein AAH995_28890 [Pseudomonas putida]|uniref:hypothetical protein n=1 Tax=Pseudomonas putida TaxID=303 RepID=UPI00215E3FE5|nr:hypothetical protein [Pseudomonas putida]UVL81135.1 hypothetical protein LOY24_13695 [Pseudomonas putida]
MATRRSRSAIEASIRETWPWAAIYTDEMSASQKDCFRYRLLAIEMYVGGDTLAEILKNTNIQRNELHRLIQRATMIAPDGLAWGARALVPNLHLNDYKRTASAAGRLPGQRGGYAGCLTQILREYPDIAEELENTILKKGGGKSKIHEYRPKPKKIHKLFLDLLAKKNISLATWPYNTKSKGEGAIRKYVKAILDQNFDDQVRIHGERPAIAHLSVGTGTESLMEYTDVYSAWEIDSYKVDAEFSVGFRNAYGLLSYLQTKRINILALVDRSSTAVIWYLVVYSPEVSASDVIRLICEALRSPLPLPSTNHLGMEIKGDAGFPSEKIEALRYGLPTVLMPDNALSNLASSVSVGLRQKLGFYIEYGPPGHFEHRPNIERTFKGIAAGLFQRLPNTTGAGPQNGRPKNATEIACAYKIEAQIVEELAYHHFAQHNALENEGIGYLTPLEFLRQKIEQFDGHFLLRCLQRDKMDEMANGRITEKAKIRSYPKKGVRPFIQLDRVRYSNNVLRSSAGLAGIDVTIQIDDQDMRTIRAFLPDGTPLGILKAAGKWSRTIHSRKTRKAINSLRSKRLLTLTENDDPVEFYLMWLSSKVEKPKKTPDTLSLKSSRGIGSEISRMNIEVGLERPDLLSTSPSKPSQQPGGQTLDDKIERQPSQDRSTRDVRGSVIPSKLPDLTSLIKDL